MARPIASNRHQAIQFIEGQVAQQQAVDECEHEAVGGDAEHERKRRRQGEGAIPEPQAGRESHVVPDRHG
jgi:hypothetical protein